MLQSGHRSLCGRMADAKYGPRDLALWGPAGSTPAAWHHRCRPRKGRLPVLFAPNSSHINQPLDESPFGGLKRDDATGNEQGILDALVSVKSVHDALLSAAYVAERRTLTPQFIVGASRRCALWPFNASAILARVGANVSLVPAGDTVQSEARSAAAAVLLGAQQRVDATRRRSVSGQATVARGVLHAPEALLAQHRARDAARASELAVREARMAEAAEQRVRKEVDAARRSTQRENNRCRACRKTVRRGGRGSLGCACDVFWVCPACAKTAVGGATMAEHSQSCTDQVSAADDEDDEEEGDLSASVSCLLCLSRAYSNAILISELQLYQIDYSADRAPSRPPS